MGVYIQQKTLWLSGCSVDKELYLHSGDTCYSSVSILLSIPLLWDLMRLPSLVAEPAAGFWIIVYDTHSPIHSSTHPSLIQFTNKLVQSLLRRSRHMNADLYILLIPPRDQGETWTNISLTDLARRLCACAARARLFNTNSDRELGWGCSERAGYFNPCWRSDAKTVIQPNTRGTFGWGTQFPSPWPSQVFTTCTHACRSRYLSFSSATSRSPAFRTSSWSATWRERAS